MRSEGLRSVVTAAVAARCAEPIAGASFAAVAIRAIGATNKAFGYKILAAKLFAVVATGSLTGANLAVLAASSASAVVSSLAI